MQEKQPKRKRLRVDGVFDIECWGWNNFLVGVTITSGGEIEVHRTPESLVDEMLLHGGHWWGHNSGKYDSLQVLEILRAGGIGQSISLSGSRVTRTMGNGLVLRDSYALIPLGLEYVAEIGKTFVPKLWFDCKCGDDCGGYCSIRKRMPPYMMLRLQEYCIQDCQALLNGLIKIQEFADECDFDLTGTIGGSSWATAKRVLGLPDANFSPNQWKSIRSAYYGGRCSVFRPCVSSRGEHWDIGSAYPSSLASVSLPTGGPIECGKKTAIRKFGIGQIGIYACTITVPRCRVPPLPWRWGSGLAFPVGSVSGVWTLTEIQYALSVGCKIDDIEWAIVWEDSEVLFDEWVKSIYTKRIHHGKKSALGEWLRLFPNSLVGKMAERPDKRYVRLNPELHEIVLCPAKRPCSLTSCVCGAWEQLDKWGQMWSVPFYRLSNCGLIHWASFVNADTRIKHRTEIERNGESSVYCDTDSLWTTSSESISDKGDGLGQWSRKCSFAEFEAPAPKSYAYVDGETGEWLVCSAGSQTKAKQWTKGNFEQDRGVLSLMDAAKSGRGLFARRHVKWTPPRHGDWYGDRRHSLSGSTIPVTCDELRIRLNERNRIRSR